MTWVEMAYRAHHTQPDDENLLVAYHKLWEDLRYYEGWVLFESPELGYSYARFKEAIERVCDKYIEKAWSQRSESQDHWLSFLSSRGRRPIRRRWTHSLKTYAITSPRIHGGAPQ